MVSDFRRTAVVAMAMACTAAIPIGALAQSAPTMVVDLTPGPSDTGFEALLDADGRLIFTEPCMGTSDGLQVSVLRQNGTCPQGVVDRSDDLGPPVHLNGVLIFEGSSLRPYRSDGTASGTYPLGNRFAGAMHLGKAADYAYFAGEATGGGGWQLWRTDGTVEGTALIKTFTNAEGEPLLLASGNRLFFETLVSNGTSIIWTTDGSPAGTVPLRSFVDGYRDAIYRGRLFGGFAVFGSTLYFSMYTPATGVELWKSDGTVGGTTPVSDVVPGALSSVPVSFASFGGRLAFIANTEGTETGSAAFRLFTTDGTPGGTSLVSSALTTSMGAPIVVVNNRMLLSGGIGNQVFGVISSDGTEPGTARISTQAFPSHRAGVFAPTVVGALAYFASSDSTAGLEVWQSDGTAGGTRRTADIWPGTFGSFPSRLTAVGGALFFTATNGVDGLELWRVGLPSSTSRPLALSDRYVVPPGATLSVPGPGVLENDLPNGGGAMTAQLASGPSTGTLALAANGGFTFDAVGLPPSTVTFTYRALNSRGASTPSRVTIEVGGAPVPISHDDSYTTPFNTALNVGAPGVMLNDTGAVSVAMVTTVSQGTLSLNANGGFNYVPPTGFSGTASFTYRASNAGGVGNVATVTITVPATPPPPQPPTNLYTYAVVGNLVTVRWTPPATGPAPTGYVMEGGVTAGAPLVAIPTGTAVPLFIFAAPNGSFYIRMRTSVGAAQSAPSNEIRVHVNVPVPPSAPTGLTGMVNNSQLSLSWLTTFAGGAPGNLILDVSGTLNASLPIGLTDTFSFNPVPAGTFTFSVRAQNGAGVSGPSNPVTLAFPQTCSGGAPQPPQNFLAFATGNVLTLLWDPATAGNATTSYLLSVGGAFNAALPLATHGLAAPVPPGTYTFTVTGVNACGASAPTAVRTVVVP